jgi:hypothetical protein
MANLTEDTQPPFDRGASVMTPRTNRVANAIRIWAGAFVGLPGANALTSSRGYFARWQDQINLQYAGIAEAQSWTGGLLTSVRTGTAANVNSVLGATSDTPVPEITVETGPVVLRGITVAGIAAQADVWRTLVYCSTDNYADLSTTATSYAPALGKPIYWYSSTRVDLQLFGQLRMTAIA